MLRFNPNAAPGTHQGTKLPSWDSSRLVFPSSRYLPEFSGAAVECGCKIDLSYWKGKGPEQFVLVPGATQSPPTAFLQVLDTFLVRGDAVAVGLPEVLTTEDNFPPDKDPWDKNIARPIGLAASFAGFHEPIVIGYSIGGIAGLVYAKVRPQNIRALVMVDLLPTVDERIYKGLLKTGDLPIPGGLEAARQILEVDGDADRVLSPDDLLIGRILQGADVHMNVNKYVRRAVHPDVIEANWELLKDLPEGLPILILRAVKGTYVSDEIAAKFVALAPQCRIEVATIQSARAHSKVFSGDTAEVQGVLGRFIDSL